MANRISQDEVLSKAAQLPAFPTVVSHILETIDDDNASLNDLVVYIERDPVIAAKVVSAAGAVGLRGHHAVHLGDVYTATSMIGLSRVRELVLQTSLAHFVNKQGAHHFWQHSVAVGVCAQELARHAAGHSHVHLDYAWVAGLLHDIGHLWLSRFYPLQFQIALQTADAGLTPLVEAEQYHFGLDHTQIGKMIAEHWKLPIHVIAAIAQHHQPDKGLTDKLVAVTHVAEVLANALNLGHRQGNQVAHLSPVACNLLRLDFSEDMQHLFGRIEARTEYAIAVFG